MRHILRGWISEIGFVEWMSANGVREYASAAQVKCGMIKIVGYKFKRLCEIRLIYYLRNVICVEKGAHFSTWEWDNRQICTSTLGACACVCAQCTSLLLCVLLPYSWLRLSACDFIMWIFATWDCANIIFVWLQLTLNTVFRRDVLSVFACIIARE